MSTSPISPPPDRTIFGHVQERFETRARALVYARLALMAIGLLVLTVPSWRRGLNIGLPAGVYWYLLLLALHVASFVWVGRRFARTVIFTTLCTDVLALLYLIVASGGIKSGLMPAQLVFTMLFALLFPSPLAIIPPLLTLPIVATVGQILGTQTPADLLLVLWYSALNVTVVYVVVYLEGRERVAFQEVIRLQRERRQQALAEQRLRIAREIHDGVGAALSGILLQAEYLVEQLQRDDGGTNGGRAAQGLDDETLWNELGELREAAAVGIDELRRAVSILHREFQLGLAVPDYVQSFSARHHLRATAEVQGREIDLAPDRQLALMRILQEALANIARHAAAAEVEVSLAFDPDGVRLVVVDDGAGFVPGEAVSGHYGLRNMAERAAKVGGTTRITSEPGEGTRVEVEIPRR